MRRWSFSVCVLILVVAIVPGISREVVAQGGGSIVGEVKFV